MTTIAIKKSVKMTLAGIVLAAIIGEAIYFLFFCEVRSFITEDYRITWHTYLLSLLFFTLPYIISSIELKMAEEEGSEREETADDIANLIFAIGYSLGMIASVIAGVLFFFPLIAIFLILLIATSR